MGKRPANKAKNNKSKNLIGTIRVIPKPMGFFSVIDESINAKKTKPKREDDIVIFEENLNCALDKDIVEVEIVGRDRDRRKGKVVKIVERYKDQFVGTLEDSAFGLVFRPDDFKFYKTVELIDPDKSLKGGTKVLARLENWTNQNLNPKGRILKVIGEKGVHETEMQSILLDKGIVYDFPADVEREAEEIAKEWKRKAHHPSLGHKGQGSRDDDFSFPETVRKDFRQITTFTIDPADAKDFDDALSYKEIDATRIEVGVHIADVSHFVRPGTALDREARKRLFSTYLVDRTIPMLPEILSNGLCSLNPNEDRLAFSAVFEIEKASGKILTRWFGKTLINSDKRFSYEEAQGVLESRSGNHELWEKNYGKELNELNRLAEIYREQNKEEGAIEFETDEIKFELDATGKPIRIYKKPRLDTMKMIEEWMLLANREVAKFISDRLKGRPGASVYRVHDLPNMEKLESLSIFIRALGHELPIKNGSVLARDINLLLSEIEGHPAESLIKTAAIRSMAKASYSTKNIGHFGLAFEYYTHFTSPIRRYPDLLVHRVLENHLNGKPIKKDEVATLQKLCDEASEKEITVAEAERDSIKYKQVEYMTQKVGQEFECTISGVTEFGIFVEEPATKAEGLIRLRDIEGDVFELDLKNYCVVGQKTKKKYALGDTVKAKLLSADLERKSLDFKLV